MLKCYKLNFSLNNNFGYIIHIIGTKVSVAIYTCVNVENNNQTKTF